MSTQPLYLKHQKITRDLTAQLPATSTSNSLDPVFTTTAAGDERKLRGIPAIGRNVTGAIPGTTPHHIR